MLTNSCTWEEIWSIYSETIQKEIGIKPRVKYLPIDKFCNCIHEPRKYQLIYDRFYDRVFDNSDIDPFIDINNFTPPNQGLSQCLSCFLKKPVFKVIKWEFEAKKDKYTYEYAKVREVGSIKRYLRYLYTKYF